MDAPVEVRAVMDVIYIVGLVTIGLCVIKGLGPMIMEVAVQGRRMYYRHRKAPRTTLLILAGTTDAVCSCGAWTTQKYAVVDQRVARRLVEHPARQLEYLDVVGVPVCPNCTPQVAQLHVALVNQQVM